MPPLAYGREQVDDLDAGLEHLGRRGEVLDRRRGAVDRPALVAGGQVLAEVDRLAEQVEDAAERRRADGDRDRAAGVEDLRAAGQAVGRVHRDRAHAVVAEVLLHLADERLAAASCTVIALLISGRSFGNEASMTTPWISSMRPTFWVAVAASMISGSLVLR